MVSVETLVQKILFSGAKGFCNRLLTSLMRKSTRMLRHHVPIDAGNTGHILGVADGVAEQSVPDLPGEHRWVLLLKVGDCIDHVGGRHLGLAAPYHTCLEVASFIEP